jgi:hypothetical protein
LPVPITCAVVGAAATGASATTVPIGPTTWIWPGSPTPEGGAVVVVVLGKLVTGPVPLVLGICPDVPGEGVEPTGWPMVSRGDAVLIGGAAAPLGGATGVGNEVLVAIAGAAVVVVVEAVAAATRPTPMRPCADRINDADIKSALNRKARCIYTSEPRTARPYLHPCGAKYLGLLMSKQGCLRAAARQFAVRGSSD